MITFYDHEVMPALRQDLACKLGICQARIEGQHHARQIAPSQKLRHRLAFVLVWCGAPLRQDADRIVCYDTHEERGGAMGSRAAHIFTVNRSATRWGWAGGRGRQWGG